MHCYEKSGPICKYLVIAVDTKATVLSTHPCVSSCSWGNHPQIQRAAHSDIGCGYQDINPPPLPPQPQPQPQPQPPTHGGYWIFWSARLCDNNWAPNTETKNADLLITDMSLALLASSGHRSHDMSMYYKRVIIFSLKGCHHSSATAVSKNNAMKCQYVLLVSQYNSARDRPP